MQTESSHQELVERLMKLMRPLSERGHGPDHDRLRELYLHRLERCVGDPLEHAMGTVLEELLHLYLHPTEEPPTDVTQLAIQAVHCAIEALATVSCRLADHNYEAAADALQAATQAIHESHACLDALCSEASMTSMQDAAVPQAATQEAVSR